MSTQPPKRSKTSKEKEGQRSSNVLRTIKNKRRKAIKEAIRTGKPVKIRISDPKKGREYETITP